ncbi:hypothetical protein AKJ09_02350 [Labilithrix luteola]|uniref:PEGA domain-containing protein n=1 Tax=Labilithrix luteola TaxID=1391654 RepID=A0A0K1PQM8_9BACT|nr:hypothetical protein AKJ09_02350 [Labilithrix luteola]
MGPVPLQGCATRRCAFSATPGLILRVKDAQSGAAICDAEVTATRADKTTNEPIFTFNCVSQGLSEGRYIVSIHKSGYVDAVRNVVVELNDDDECKSVRTVELEVALDPE